MLAAPRGIHLGAHRRVSRRRCSQPAAPRACSSPFPIVAEDMADDRNKFSHRLDRLTHPEGVVTKRQEREHPQVPLTNGELGPGLRQVCKQKHDLAVPAPDRRSFYALPVNVVIRLIVALVKAAVVDGQSEVIVGPTGVFGRSLPISRTTGKQ